MEDLEDMQLDQLNAEMAWIRRLARVPAGGRSPVRWPGLLEAARQHAARRAVERRPLV